MSTFDQNVDAIDKLIGDLTARAIRAEDALAKLNKRHIAALPDLIGALQECAEYLDNYTDAEVDPDTGRTIPNEAMTLLNRVEVALRKAGVEC